MMIVFGLSDMYWFRRIVQTINVTFFMYLCQSRRLSTRDLNPVNSLSLQYSPFVNKIVDLLSYINIVSHLELSHSKNWIVKVTDFMMFKILKLQMMNMRLNGDLKELRVDLISLN